MKVAIVYPEEVEMYFGLISRAMCAVLRQLGYDAEIAHDIKIKSDIVIVQCGLGYRDFRPIPSQKYVLVQMEQFPNSHSTSGWQQEKWDATKRFVHHYDAVWDTYYDIHKHLYGNQNACQFFLGYHPLFDTRQALPKLYDVSFLGHVGNSRRRSLLGQIPNLHVVTNKLDKQDRTNLVCQSKINLNIHYSDSPLLETLRVIVIIMSNGGFVMTENFVGCDQLIDGEHLVVVDDKNIVDKTRYYLEEEKERLRIADQGNAFLVNSFTLEKHMKYCLDRL